jgi:hypothetical protein
MENRKIRFTPMRWWEVILRGVQFVWVLPATIVVWALYIIPFWVTGAIRYRGSPDMLVAEFALDRVCSPEWYENAWEHWAGWGGPCVMIMNPAKGADTSWVMRRHEVEHCLQQFRWGIFFYLIYGGAWLWLWLFTSRHPYLDNPFEVWAREAAGEPGNRAAWTDVDGRRIIWRK